MLLLCRRGLRRPVGGLLRASPARLSTHAEEREGNHSLSQGFDGDGSFGNSPTEKQLLTAQTLAKQTGQLLPDDAAQDDESYSAFIKNMSLVPPSEAQLKHAEKLAEDVGELLPESAYESATALSAYVFQMRARTGRGAQSIDSQWEARSSSSSQSFIGDDPSLPPTERQLKYAQSLALQTEQQLPNDAATNREKCSEFIDKMLRNTPPSDRQVQFAQDLAMQAGESLPEDATRSKAAVKEYIEQMLNQQQGRESYPAAQRPSQQPSKAQLEFAISLAVRKGVGLPAEALSTKTGCSAFISLMIEGRNEVYTPTHEKRPSEVRAAAPTQHHADEEVPF